jgi:2OG-Fe(II) oxygenase superfamily
MCQSEGSVLSSCLNYQRRGYLALQAGETPYSSAEWEELKHLMLNYRLRFKLAKSGDTGEAADVSVLGIVHDGNPPTDDDPALANALLRLIGSPVQMAFYERILGEKDLVIRRAQAHILGPAGFIGRHRDNESNPDYLAAVVLQLRPAERGGAFALYHPDGCTDVVDRFAMLITDADLPHEVLQVQSGQRASLAFWLAKRNSP